MLEKIHKTLEGIINDSNSEAILIYLEKFPSLQEDVPRKIEIAYNNLVVCQVYQIDKSSLTDKKQSTYRIVDARRQLTFLLYEELKLKKNDIKSVLGINERNFYRYLKDFEDMIKHPVIHKDFNKKRVEIIRQLKQYE